MGKNRPPVPSSASINKNRLKAALDLSDGSADRSIGDDDIRGGCRGGRADFTWDTVKVDKQRNMYLGNSVKANTWRSARPSDWYKQSTIGVGEEPVEEIKREEEVVRKIAHKFGYGALNELEKYKGMMMLQEEENKSNDNDALQRKPKPNLMSLKEELKRELRRQGK